MDIKCSRYPGLIITRYSETGYLYYLDQIDEYPDMNYPEDPENLTWNDNWIRYNSFRTYIKKWYNLSPQEYYQLIVFGDKDKCPICPYCNERPLRWANETRLSSGYTKCCQHEDCWSKVCSESGKRNLEIYTHEELSRRQSINGSKKWINTTEEQRREIMKPVYTAGNTVSSRALQSYNLLLTQGDKNDLMYFYIAISSDNKFKFGVTKDIDNRLDWSHPYKNWKLLFKDKRFRLAELEYWIKLDINSITEYIEWDLVPKFINSYVKRYKEIIVNKERDW